MEQKKLDRINELARKARIAPLTEAELEEQRQLRNEYRMAVVGNLRQHLDHTVVVRPDGTKEKLKQEEA